MAEKVVKDLGKDFLNCCICMGGFKKPKMLPCIHSFCEECLEKYAAKKGSNEISCPTCRKTCKLPETGVKGLQTNFHLVNLAEKVLLLEKLTTPQTKEAAMCDSCKNPEIVAYCVDCNFAICAKCQIQHSLFPSLQTHSIIPLTQLSDPNFQQGCKQVRTPYCQIHSSEKLHFYCETCSQLICRDCTIVLHAKPEHTYVDASSKFADIKDHLGKLLESSKDQLERSSTLVKSGEKGYDLMGREERRVEEALDAACKKNLLEIEGKYNDLKKQMLGEIAQRKPPVEEGISYAKNWIKRMRNTQEITQTVIEENNPWELLALSADLTAAFAELTTDSESIDLGPHILKHDILVQSSPAPEIQSWDWCSLPVDVVATDGAGNFFLCDLNESSKLLSVLKSTSNTNDLDMICSYKWTDDVPKPYRMTMIASDKHLFVAIGNLVVKIDHGTKQFVSKATLSQLGLIHCMTYDRSAAWIYFSGPGTNQAHIYDSNLSYVGCSDLQTSDVTSLCSFGYEIVYCSHAGTIKHYNLNDVVRKTIQIPLPHKQQTMMQLSTIDSQYTLFVLQQVTGEDKPKETPESDYWMVQEYRMDLKRVVALLDCSEVGMTKPPESLFTVTAEDRSVTLHLCDRLGTVTKCKRGAYEQAVLKYKNM